MRLRLKESRKLAKYAFVGGLNTGVDFGAFVALVYAAGMPSIGAQVISYTAALVNSYFWNRRWTFQVKRKTTIAELLQFLTVNAASFTVATGVLLGLEQWGIHSAIAKIVSVSFGLAVNYAGYRLWVFRQHAPQSETE